MNFNSYIYNIPVIDELQEDDNVEVMVVMNGNFCRLPLKKLFKKVKEAENELNL
ncbi:hypothetical protein [Bartonella sp. DGB1]|uniref:hypothetical protein n=1 Tax=Bartonella sp. DGB1 TaxID=3239807 RepID=UPI0035258489